MFMSSEVHAEWAIFFLYSLLNKKHIKSHIAALGLLQWLKNEVKQAWGEHCDDLEVATDPEISEGPAVFSPDPLKPAVTPY